MDFVYLVTTGSWEDYQVVAAYRTMDDAARFCAERNKNIGINDSDNIHSVEPFELEAVNHDAVKDYNYLHRFWVQKGGGKYRLKVFNKPYPTFEVPCCREAFDETWIGFFVEVIQADEDSEAAEVKAKEFLNQTHPG